jgi:hypothetical protein
MVALAREKKHSVYRSKILASFCSISPHLHHAGQCFRVSRWYLVILYAIFTTCRPSPFLTVVLRFLLCSVCRLLLPRGDRAPPGTVSWALTGPGTSVVIRHSFLIFPFVRQAESLLAPFSPGGARLFRGHREKVPTFLVSQESQICSHPRAVTSFSSDT